MLDRGKLAVLAMLGLAVAAAAFAWFWNYRRGERCLALYGSEAAALIRTAKTVEILEVDPQSPAEVLRRIDISQAPGLLNARTALLDDASFEWNSPPPASGQSGLLIRFADGNREVLLRLDHAQRSLEVITNGKSATLKEKTSGGWETFLRRLDKP